MNIRDAMDLPQAKYHSPQSANVKDGFILQHDGIAITNDNSTIPVIGALSRG